MSYDIIIKGGTLATVDGQSQTDIAITDGRFAAIGDLGAEAAGTVIDAAGLTVLPGVIDTQVHFREPGNEHKEDLESGSLAAVMGGVTAVFEMPNTKPPTTTVEAIADKVRRGTDRMHCDFAFYAGGTAENAELLPELERQPGVCGVKVFMGSSTGNLLVADDEGVSKILQNIKRRAAFHSEDEFRLRERRPLAETGNVLTHPVWRDAEAAISSTRRLLKMARETGKKNSGAAYQHGGGNADAGRQPRFGDRRGDAPASDFGIAGLLRKDRHIRPDESSDPGGSAPGCLVEGAGTGGG